jgi:hypothetical protein
MAVELLAIGGPLLAGAVWVLDRAERLRRHVQLASQGTLTDLRQMREGLVGIQGRIAALDEPLQDAVTDVPVVFWRWSVQREDKSGPVELSCRSDRVPFRVVAGGAEVIVEPHRAQVRVREARHEVPVAAITKIAPVGRMDGPTLQAVGGTLAVGSMVYVLGVAERLRVGAGPFRGTPEQFRIRAARGLPFVVSATPEEALLEACRRTAHRALALGTGALLGGAALLAAALGG